MLQHYNTAGILFVYMCTSTRWFYNSCDFALLLSIFFMSTGRTPFGTSLGADLVMNFLSCCLSEKVLIYLSFLKDSFGRYGFLG